MLHSGHDVLKLKSVTRCDVHRNVKYRLWPPRAAITAAKRRHMEATRFGLARWGMF